jgi:hypothetical protein
MPKVAVLLAFLSLVSSPAAAVVRAWVATTGVDTNDCSRSFPCRTYGAAINAVDEGGQVVNVDSGGFGPFTINKAVWILTQPGTIAAISPTAGTAITIDVPAPGPSASFNALSESGAGAVKLQGLTLDSQGATRGVNCRNAPMVFLWDFNVQDFPDAAIDIEASGNAPVTYISRSRFTNNNIGIRSGASSVKLNVTDTTIDCSSQNAVRVEGSGTRILSSNLKVTDCGADCVVIDGDNSESLWVECTFTRAGASAWSVPGDGVKMNLRDSHASQSTDGLNITGSSVFVKATNSSFNQNTDDGCDISGPGAMFACKDCDASQNGDDGFSCTSTLSESTFEECDASQNGGWGWDVDCDGCYATASGSNASENGAGGFRSVSRGTSPHSFLIYGSRISGNSTGIQAGDSSSSFTTAVCISSSTVVRNNTAFAFFVNNNILTAGDNNVQFNFGGQAFSGPCPKQ